MCNFYKKSDFDALHLEYIEFLVCFFFYEMQAIKTGKIYTKSQLRFYQWNLNQMLKSMTWNDFVMTSLHALANRLEMTSFLVKESRTQRIEACFVN